jgi:hypothetical protein
MTDTAKLPVSTPAGLAANRKFSRLRVLLAADHTPTTVVAGGPDLVASDTEARTLSGVLIPYGGQVGYTSAGPVTCSAGVVQVPDDLARVKLVDEHRSPPRAIGYLASARDTSAALRGSFRVGRTPDGDRALLEASERVRDAFSVELADVTINERSELVAGRLTAVALVTVPAWADSRSDGLAAALADTTTTKGTRMTPEQIARLAELAAMNQRDADQEQEYATLTALAVQEVTSGDPAAEPPTADDQASLAASIAGQVVTGLTASGQAAVPSGLTIGNQNRSQRPLRDLYAAMANVLGGRSRPSLEAALSDITTTANVWTSQTQYDSQLWSGLEYVRRFVPLMAPGEMNSYKGTGWRWVVKPEVDDYAGDKAAVPSNLPTTEAADWIAARLAGAHDLDRKFVDFGDQEFIAAYYEAMRESYAMQSDDKARAFLLAQATPVGGAAETSLFRAAAVAAQAVSDNTRGAQVDYFLINSADSLALLDITANDVPAYLETFGVTPDKFITTPGQVAGTVTAGTRNATKFRELSSTPIRVEAINIVNGGVDGGVFGYYATQRQFAGGLVSKTFA